MKSLYSKNCVEVMERLWDEMTAMKELALQRACSLGKASGFMEGYRKTLERQKSHTCKNSLTKHLLSVFRSEHLATHT